MHTVLSMTDRTWDERWSLSVSRRRVHEPLRVLMGIALGALNGIVMLVYR
jgi:hypothetical protein